MENNLVDEYVYEALPDPELCVRLLTIRPSARFDDPIICNITIVRLASSRRILNSATKIFRRIEYTALSYCWGMNEDGDAALNRSITIEGKKKLVTQNLFEGLLRVRRRTHGITFPTLALDLQEAPPSRIWIDAISINQKDPNERSSQVLIMDKIYRYASHLLVWLGEGNSPVEDREVLAVLRCMYRKHCRRVDMTDRLTLEPQSALEDDTGIGAELSALYHDLIMGYTIFRDVKVNTAIPTMLKTMGLLNRFVKKRSKRYFSRRWIVQELLYGREQADCHIYWGPVSCPDYVFIDGLRGAEWFCNYVKNTPELESRDPPPHMWVQDMRHLLLIADLVELLPSHLQRRPTVLYRIVMPIIAYGVRFNHGRINNIRTIELIRDRYIGDRLPRSTEIVGFLDALRRFHQNQCSDPRDILYALASLDPSFGLIANYSRSIEEVFTDLARILVTRNKCDELLLNLAAAIHQAHARPSRPLQILDLPSWVPDFRAPFRDPGIESSYMYEASTIDECILKCTLDQVAMVFAIRDVMVDVEFQPDPNMDMESTPRRAGYPFWELRGSIPEEVFDSMDAFYRPGDKFCRIGHSTNNLLVLRPCDDTSEYHAITNVIGSISSDTRDVPTFSWAPGRATVFKIR